MRGNKKKHKEMWDYLIDHVDEILKKYQGDDPENTIIDFKQEYIDKYDEGRDVIYNCYACESFAVLGCSECKITKNAGECTKSDSSFHYLLEAVKNGNKEEFINHARRIRDAW